jgi:hypothetical protein
MIASESRLRFIISCDPGVKGALCFMSPSAVPIEFFDMPIRNGKTDGAGLAAIVEMCLVRAGRGNIHAVVENVGSRPGQAHSFSFGTGFGIILGVIETLGVPYSLISASQWKPAMGLGRALDESKSSTKSRARQLASKLLPQHADKFEKAKNADRAEAYLIGRFYIFKNAGGFK